MIGPGSQRVDEALRAPTCLPLVHGRGDMTGVHVALKRPETTAQQQAETERAECQSSANPVCSTGNLLKIGA